MQSLNILFATFDLYYRPGVPNLGDASPWGDSRGLKLVFTWVHLYQWGDAIDVKADADTKRLGTPVIDCRSSANKNGHKLKKLKKTMLQVNRMPHLNSKGPPFGIFSNIIAPSPIIFENTFWASLTRILSVFSIEKVNHKNWVKNKPM